MVMIMIVIIVLAINGDLISTGLADAFVEEGDVDVANRAQVNLQNW